MVHDPEKSPEILTVFPRFLDTPGMVCESLLWITVSLSYCSNIGCWGKQSDVFETQHGGRLLHQLHCYPLSWQIQQDFGLLFGDATSAKLLEKWPTVYKQKVIEQSSGLTQTGELQDLVQNAKSTAEVEDGNTFDMYFQVVINVFLNQVKCDLAVFCNLNMFNMYRNCNLCSQGGRVICRPFWSWFTFCHPHLKAVKDRERSQSNKPVIILWNS